MNVLIATIDAPRHTGGVSSHLADLEQALRQAGTAAVLVAGDDPSPSRALLLKGLAFAGAAGRVPWARCRYQVLVSRHRAAGLARRLAAARDAGDLVHAHDVLAANAARDMALPVVLTVHGMMYREFNRRYGATPPSPLDYYLAQERRAFAEATEIIAVSRHRKETLVADYGVPAAKITVLLNPVDTDRFAPAEDGEEDDYFLVPRHLERHYGVHTAIEALALVPDSRCRLYLAGDGSERARLAALAEERGLADRVRFLGRLSRDRVAELMRRALAVIVPSLPLEGVIEGCPLAVLEGMSAGRPVIGSVSGGMPEIITPGHNGLLFPPGDAGLLAARMSDLLADEALRREMGRRARDYVLREHSFPVWTGRLLQVYRRAVSDLAAHAHEEGTA